jgi:predicted anti-sigma-YlaC factor YlaD
MSLTVSSAAVVYEHILGCPECSARYRRVSIEISVSANADRAQAAKPKSN